MVGDQAKLVQQCIATLDGKKLELEKAKTDLAKSEAAFQSAKKNYDQALTHLSKELEKMDQNLIVGVPQSQR